VKTEYSDDELPLDPNFATVLLDWKARAPTSALMFPSHVTGRNLHASPIRQDYIRPAEMLPGGASAAQGQQAGVAGDLSPGTIGADGLMAVEGERELW
jgi:hypothetical protein